MCAGDYYLASFSRVLPECLCVYLCMCVCVLRSRLVTEKSFEERRRTKQHRALDGVVPERSLSQSKIHRQSRKPSHGTNAVVSLQVWSSSVTFVSSSDPQLRPEYRLERRRTLVENYSNNCHGHRCQRRKIEERKRAAEMSSSGRAESLREVCSFIRLSVGPPNSINECSHL